MVTAVSARKAHCASENKKTKNICFCLDMVHLLRFFESTLSALSTMVLSPVCDCVQLNNYSLVITEYR